MTTRAKQIVVLEIEADLTKLPLPEEWDWDDIAQQLDGAATVRQIAAGQPEFSREAITAPDIPADVLTRLRSEYFVAGGEMTTAEACALIDKALSCPMTPPEPENLSEAPGHNYGGTD